MTLTLKHPFAICVENEGYGASLELWKVYRVIPDREAAEHGLMRVADESGEDYLYPTRFFERLALPAKLRRRYRAKSRRAVPA